MGRPSGSVKEAEAQRWEKEKRTEKNKCIDKQIVQRPFSDEWVSHPSVEVFLEFQEIL